MAALSGNTETMSKLILWGANKDAVASSIGPVINGAIISGITEAVTMLIELGVKLSGQHGTDENEDHDQQESGDSKEPSWEPPLPLAAMISDVSMFSTILEAGNESLTHMDLAKALFYASGSGRIEIVEKLLNYEHEPHNFQASLDSATEERNWDVVCLLLRRCEGLDCDAAFKSAATGSENLLEVLEECWKHTGESIPEELLDSCLYTATDFEKEETVIKLLEFGADPNAPGEE
jgi:ankyrin repeat protein